MKLKLFLLLVLLSAFMLANAQEIRFNKENFPGKEQEFLAALKWLNNGNKHMNKRDPDYLSAVSEYLKANSFNPSDAQLNFNLGNAFLHLGEPLKAKSFFLNAQKLNPGISEDLSFFLGKAYHLSAEWDSALYYYENFKKLSDPINQEKQNIVSKKIMECKNGLLLRKNENTYSIRNAGKGINSISEEYAPYINLDETKLFFTSRREGTTGNGFDKKTGLFFEDIYYSLKGNEDWGLSINAGKNINTEFHDAVCGIFPDGQTLIIFRGDINDGDLFYVKNHNGKWSEPADFGPAINTEYHESSACLSTDGTKLYFVSDKPGGFGGRDIYVSTFDIAENTWGQSQNLGSIINSEYDEEGVFLHPDNKTLFFASNGGRSIGGYDIFKSENDKGIWSVPDNLGEPINTPEDDVFISVSSNGRNFYFSSRRNDGYGGKDIYIATPDSIRFIPKMTLLTGDVTDEFTGKPIEARIDLIDLSTNKKINTYQNDKETGKYVIPLPGGKSYGTVIYADGYIFESENVEVADTASYAEIKHHKRLKKIEAGSVSLLNNIFFESGQSAILPSSENELDNIAAFLFSNESLQIEICGHTDNVGDFNANMQLSEKRGEAVYLELIKRNIPPQRMSFKGYGETLPVVSNATMEGRKKNRRIEFRIIKK